MSKRGLWLVVALAVVILGIAVTQPRIVGAQTLASWWDLFSSNAPAASGQYAQAGSGKGSSTSIFDFSLSNNQQGDGGASVFFRNESSYQYDRNELFDRRDNTKTYYAADGDSVRIPIYDFNKPYDDAIDFVRACPRDAKVCPDGSVVGRTGPNCAFVCPNQADNDTGPGGTVACTQDAKICPDGSAVGRVGPHCTFAACPGSEDTSNDADEITTESSIIGQACTWNGKTYAEGQSCTPDRCPTQTGGNIWNNGYLTVCRNGAWETNFCSWANLLGPRGGFTCSGTYTPSSNVNQTRSYEYNDSGLRSRDLFY